MTSREFASIFAASGVVAWTLNVAWLAVLAAPASWLWNWAAVPVSGLPNITYGRAFGLLLLYFVVRLGHIGIKVSSREAGGRG